ncbi:MAG: MFS transporter [Alphaproteobacteria bacterium]
MSGASADRLPELAGGSVETRASWLVASVALVILSFSYGAPLVTAVALKPIAAELGSSRSLPALAGSLAWLGSGLGGIPMGWLAERIGVRWTVMFGAVMMGAGLALSAAGGVWLLVFAHAVVVGLAGMGGINVPLMTHVSRWFDRRRGTALALISSGQYVAGVVWPALFERAVDHFGWRHTMELFGALAVVAILPLAALCLSDPPKATVGTPSAASALHAAGVTAWHPGTAFALLCLAGFLCCVPMAMPQAHLVAFCSDIGITPAHGALMLSLLLGCAFVSRQFWGWLSDRIGGLATVLVGSACQSVALAAFLLTQDEVGLFTVAAFFGLGFSGIVPAYVLAICELFPMREVGWRLPVWFCSSLAGMAVGGWLAGVLYDYFGFYAPAFAVGVAFNIANLFVILWLIARRRAARVPALAA